MFEIFYLFIYYITTNTRGLKVPDPYQAELLGHISLLQCPRQETFWASAGFESTEESINRFGFNPIAKKIRDQCNYIS